MNVQQVVPQEQNPKHPLSLWRRVRVIFIGLLATLWRLVVWMWSILVIGIVVGVLGNSAFTILTTGKIDLTGTLLVIAWFYAHLSLCLTILMPTLLITLCSYLAHQRKQRTAQESQRVHDTSLVVVAQGVQWALDELNAKPAPLPPQGAVNEHATAPKMIWNIPYLRNPFFTGREDLLKRLHDQLKTTKATALTQPQAINGLGGIGKTQIAIEYAYRYRQDYRYIFWAHAATHDTFTTDFVRFARLLQLPEQSEQEHQLVVDAVKHWFTDHINWLLILDNADDIALTYQFMPTGAAGHIILTTRQQAIGNLANKLEIEQMTQEEGMLLLLRRANVIAPEAPLAQAPEDQRKNAQAIVQQMDGLPLALDQAGAYIEETGCSLSNYLEHYKQRKIVLLRRRGKHNADHPEPVATTWSLSFEQVEQVSPIAADLLRCCAFLSPDAIPEELFREGAYELGSQLQQIESDLTELDEAIATLRRFSFIRRNSTNSTLSIHRLVQDVIKGSMIEETQRLWAERVIRAVDQVFPSVEPTNWPQCERLLPQAQACSDLINHYKLAFPDAAGLLNMAAHYLLINASYAEAEPLFKCALIIYNQVLGLMHPGTATSLNNLAELYRTQGKYEQAEPLYQRALVILEKTLGPAHPETTRILNNLALLYHDQGKYEQAEPLYQRALAIREQALGPTYPGTATSLNNLATLYHDQGKYEQAEPLYQRALAIREKTLGPTHPDTATSLGNLATFYRTQGKYEQAEPLYQRALAICEQQLGPDHPYTAQSLDNLAELNRIQGKYEQAELLYQRVITIYQKAFGPHHPGTQTIQRNYTRFLEEKKRKRR